MSGHMFSLFDMAIGGIPALAFGIWQLVSVNRDIARDKPVPPGSPESAGHSVGEHRLDER